MKGYTPRLFAMMPLMMALTLSAPFVATQRASLNFYSSSSVWPGVFSQLAAASFDGVMTYDYALPPGVPVGYVQSSPQPQPWWGTMWTRDAGAFLRECVLWGDVDAAAATAQLLMQLAPKNPAGFISFPGRFDLLQPGDTSLSEVDASASIFISSVLLWQRLPASHPLRTRLLDFLLGNSSVVRGFKAQLSQRPLVHGSGEFGGGAFTPGEWVNVAQNAFVAAAFDAAASISHGFEGHGYDDDWAADANTLRAAMLDIMTNSTTGGWCSTSTRSCATFYPPHSLHARYWAVNATTLQPDPTVTDSEVNIGFGGLNGPLTYLADVGGYLPLQTAAYIEKYSPGTSRDGMSTYISRCVATFDALLSVPQRRLLFDEYGIWTQFDTFRGGCASGPSYGHGYATQAMLMMDRLQEAGQAIAFLANVTYNNGTGWGQVRNPMYFYEQFVVPPVHDMAKLGCGELNIVTVMEPLKVARLILGVNDWVVGNVSLIPRIAPQW